MVKAQDSYLHNQKNFWIKSAKQMIRSFTAIHLTIKFTHKRLTYKLLNILQAYFDPIGATLHFIYANSIIQYAKGKAELF